MGDVSKIIGIILFWVFLTFMFTLYAFDVSFGQELDQDFNTTEVLESFNATINEEISLLTPFKFIGMTFQIFTFSIPNVSFTANILISLVNWILVVVFALLIYRQVRSGAG